MILFKGAIWVIKQFVISYARWRLTFNYFSGIWPSLRIVLLPVYYRSANQVMPFLHSSPSIASLVPWDDWDPQTPQVVHIHIWQALPWSYHLTSSSSSLGWFLYPCPLYEPQVPSILIPFFWLCPATEDCNECFPLLYVPMKQRSGRQKQSQVPVVEKR